ncbi:hypothetical protein OAA01_01525 [Pelagibacteraceae bacterium]|jgi:hypothetical protein|nr:hypothetical protein [Pelagibacteraceae bacterium]|tara:strand:- start:459 stop:1076 length:618 start_codon:yes stop_codon:yes gene_type:complete
MSVPEFHVNILNKNYINEIESIWIKTLPDNLKSIIGKKTILIYLNKYFNNKKNLGTGIFNKKKLIGFVLFGLDNKIIKEILKENIFYIFSSFLENIVKFKIKNLIRYFNVIFFLMISSTKENKILKNNNELLIIAINKHEQNKGLGSQLLSITFKRYNNYFLNYNNIFVKTLKSTPENIKFYIKNNFNIEMEIFGRVYLKTNAYK